MKTPCYFLQSSSQRYCESTRQRCKTINRAEKKHTGADAFPSSDPPHSTISAHTGHSIVHTRLHLLNHKLVEVHTRTDGATGWCCHLGACKLHHMWIRENRSITNGQRSAQRIIFLDISLCWSRDRKFNTLATCCFGLFLVALFQEKAIWQMWQTNSQPAHLFSFDPYSSSKDFARATYMPRTARLYYWKFIFSRASGETASAYRAGAGTTWTLRDPALHAEVTPPAASRRKVWLLKVFQSPPAVNITLAVLGSCSPK